MVQNNQESRLKYWATRSSVCSFARTAHLFACTALLALLAGFAALTCSLTLGLDDERIRSKFIVGISV